MFVKDFFKQYLSQKQKSKINTFISKWKLLFLKKQIGKNSYIDPTVNVFGWAHVSIGENTLIGEQSWLNVNGREIGFKHIKIGDNCYIGRRNLLSSSRELIIGDFVMTNNECKFLGSNHVFDDPMCPYITTGTTNDDIQKIGANVWIGAGTIVLGSVNIGQGSIIGAGSIVTKDVPPFSVAVGNPCRVVKRYDFSKKEWVKTSDFNIDLEHLMPSEEEYVQELRSKSKGLILPLMAATSRYGDLY